MNSFDQKLIGKVETFLSHRVTYTKVEVFLIFGNDFCGVIKLMVYKTAMEKLRYQSLHATLLVNLARLVNAQD